MYRVRGRRMPPKYARYNYRKRRVKFAARNVSSCGCMVFLAAPIVFILMIALIR